MNELEDEPLDVQLATPVEHEVRKGQIDELSRKKADGSVKRTCKKERPIETKADCCEVKRAKRSTPKTVKMLVFGPECNIQKERVYPHCLTKDEYLNFLATPKAYCPTQCAKVEEVRRVLPLAPRIEELAKPTKRRLLGTLETYGSTLTAEKLDHLIQYVEGGTALTPEHAENIVRDRTCSRKLGKRKKRKKKKIECPSQAKKPKKVVCEPSIDLEAANCQLTIAQCFVRSILCRPCAYPRENYRDIAKVILGRLSKVLEYEPVGPQDRKSQQMRLLADVFACWIIGILIEIADMNKAALGTECTKREREAEERALFYAELSAMDDENDQHVDDDDDDDDDDDSDKDDDSNEDDDDDDGDGNCDGNDDDETLNAPTSKIDACEDIAECQSKVDLSKIESSTQCDVDDIACQATETADEELQCNPDDLACNDRDECIEECVDDGQQTESHPKFDAGCITEDDDDYCQMKKIASRMSASFETDVPFVTFAKIFDTLYCMIETESENALCDPIDNRIHRAIYEKLEKAVLLENPALLTPKIKDVINVNAGKIALWIRRTLECEQINELIDNPAEVESKEIRCWSKWVLQVADRGIDQSDWLNRTIGKLKDIRQCNNMTRDGWQQYTSEFNSNAMHFRRAYIEAQHQQHHNTMMMTDRKIVKTGCKRKSSGIIDSEECHATDVHDY